MNFIIPNRFAVVAGSADGPSNLNSFDRALLRAGAGNLNLVKVSSILPPQAIKGSATVIPEGSIVFTALGAITSSSEDELISAAVAVGVPKDPSRAGVLMEGSFRFSKEDAELRVRKMVEVAFQDRKVELARIESISTDIRVKKNATALAAVLLWCES